MNSSFLTNIGRSLRESNRWLLETPERALEQAYDAALTIRAIEDEYFEGNRITASSDKYSRNVCSYLQSELKKYLKIAEIRLTEFKASRVVINSTSSAAFNSSNKQSDKLDISDREQASIVLEKLEFIDATINRYKVRDSPPSASLVPVPQPPSTGASTTERLTKPNQSQLNDISLDNIKPVEIDQGDNILDKTGVLPRSILGTLNRIKRELDPNSEEQVVRNFRSARVKTIVSIRFILLLIIIPLLAQQLSKTLVVGPLVDHFRASEDTEIFINFELEEEALSELRTFEERLRLDGLLGRTPRLSDAEVSERMQEKAREIAETYSQQSSNAVKNVFADVVSVIFFAIVIANSRREIQVLKSFIDETVYGLSDSAKAFIIILFTNMFVGFHSPHGWEVLLEGLSRHLGLPANREFIFLFIATFPVILDTIFKYWIFRYLNRISPSAVATYRNMNE